MTPVAVSDTPPPPAAAPDRVRRVANALLPGVPVDRPAQGRWVERAASSPLTTRYVTP